MSHITEMILLVQDTECILQDPSKTQIIFS